MSHEVPDVSGDVVANSQYAYDPEYAAKLAEAARTKECIFCKPEFQDNEEKLVLTRQGWRVRRSDFPPDDSQGGKPEYSLLIFPTSHEEFMTPSDWIALGEIESEIAKMFKLQGWGLCVRRGHPLWSGRTVLHLHWQLIVPRIVSGVSGMGDKPVAAYVNFPIG